MKRNGSHLRQYLPWLGLLLGVDALAALLLWLTDARAFAAMAAVIVLATVFLFAGVCAVLCARSKRREQAFTAFLTTPDAAHEQALCRLLSPAESQSAHLLGETLRAQQQTIAQLQTQMDDYENYVELWTHEVKTPLALLTLVLDNRRDTLPEAVGFKLDYVRNRMQAFIDQMLYYARLRGARRDYRFERLALRSCIDEVLDDYRPLLEEIRGSFLPGTNLSLLLHQLFATMLTFAGRVVCGAVANSPELTRWTFAQICCFITPNIRPELLSEEGKETV